MGRKALATRVIALSAILALVVVACGEATTDDTAATTAAGGGTEAAGGGDAPNPDVLITTLDDDIFNLDPAAVNGNDAAQNVIQNLYDRLLAIPPDSGSPVPALATEVPTDDNGLISEDGLTYTFPLREDVVFTDGTDMTAEDVKYSWDRVVEMNLPEGQAPIFDNVAETRIVDDYTFEVTLDQVDASFLAFLATHPVASVVSMDAVEANGGVEAGQPNEYMAQNPVGTGPYMLDTWERGERISFDINPDYWGEPANLPVRMELLVVEKAPGLQAREYDIIDITPDDVPSVEGIENAVIDTSQLDLQVLQIGMNMNIPEVPEGDTIPPDFFQDVRVRQAFNYAYDYEGYIEGILDGLGGRNSFILPQEMYGYDPEAPFYETDTEMAEQLFREAGYWEDGFTVSILADNSSPVFNGQALVLKDSIEALNPNFHVNVLSVPEAQFDQALTADPLEVPMFAYTSLQFASPDPYLFDSALTTGRYGSLLSFAEGYSDPEMIDDMIASARTALDEEERLEILSEIQQVLYEEAMWIMPANEAAPLGRGEWVQGHVENPMWPRPGQYWAIYDK